MGIEAVGLPSTQWVTLFLKRLLLLLSLGFSLLLFLLSLGFSLLLFLFFLLFLLDFLLRVMFLLLAQKSAEEALTLAAGLRAALLVLLVFFRERPSPGGRSTSDSGTCGGLTSFCMSGFFGGSLRGSFSGWAGSRSGCGISNSV